MANFEAPHTAGTLPNVLGLQNVDMDTLIATAKIYDPTAFNGDDNSQAAAAAKWLDTQMNTAGTGKVSDTLPHALRAQAAKKRKTTQGVSHHCTPVGGGTKNNMRRMTAKNPRARNIFPRRIAHRSRTAHPRTERETVGLANCHSEGSIMIQVNAQTTTQNSKYVRAQSIRTVASSPTTPSFRGIAKSNEEMHYHQIVACSETPSSHHARPPRRSASKATKIPRQKNLTSRTNTQAVSRATFRYMGSVCNISVVERSPCCPLENTQTMEGTHD